MTIIVLTLLIPLLGLAILTLDSQRQVAIPFSHRPYWTKALQFAGILSVGTGLTLLAISANLNHSVGMTLVQFPLIASLGLLTILTGVQTFRVPRSWPAPDEDASNVTVIDRYMPLSPLLETNACHLRSGAWVMLGYPLLYVLPIFGVIGAFLLIIAAMAFSAFLQNRRAFHTQLLWLITIAVRNKLPLAEELRSLSTNKGVKLGKSLQLAAQDLDHGDTLSMALERHRLLPASTLSAIRVSEGGGRFEETLRRLSINTTERLNTFNLSRLSELFVQVFSLLCAWSLIITFVMYFIMPKIREIFTGFNVQLPVSTQILIDTSDYFLRASSATIFWLGIGMAVFIWQALRHLVGWSSLPFPTLMHWFPKRDAPEVLRALGGIAMEQASLPQTLLQLTDRRGRPDLGMRYRHISESLSAGETLSQALFAEGLITPLQKDAVAAGERGGHLQFVLFSLADAIEQREFRRGAYWAELLKPFAIVTCGIATGFVVIALFLPLIKLLNDLS